MVLNKVQDIDIKVNLLRIFTTVMESCITKKLVTLSKDSLKKESWYMALSTITEPFTPETSRNGRSTDKVGKNSPTETSTSALGRRISNTAFLTCSSPKKRSSRERNMSTAF